MGWLLLYFGGMAAFWIWAYVWQSRKQRKYLKTRIRNGILNFEPTDGGSGINDLRTRRDICPRCGEPIPQLAGHF